jgi:hypothetical protein
MALIAVVAVLVLAGVLLSLSSFGFTKVSVDRDRSTNAALAKAKEGLIAYAVADANRPGELPCPDVNNDGQLTPGEDFGGGGACTSLIGRLPWQTLGLPDLRDDSGEPLWYALSGDFRAGNNVPLNSDTAFRAGNTSLSIVGTTPAANVVAIVFSPGEALRRTDGVRQSRGCIVGTDCDANFKCTALPATSVAKCNPVNYLDLASGEDNANLANRIFASATRSDSFNDRLMPIFSDDIMKLVERRAAREFAQHLRDHYNAWSALAGAPGYTGFKGFYPYAATWFDPSAPPQVGTNGTTLGLLPLASTPLVWSNASASCGGNGTQTLDCSALVICVLICLTNFSGRVENVGTRFVDPPAAANVQVLGVALAGSPNWTLNAAQRRLDFSYNGGVLAIGLARIRVSVPVASNWTAGWLPQNNWQQNAGYVFAAGYAIDGVNSCGGAAPTCLTLLNTAVPNNNKRTIVAMSGRSLSSAGQTARPVSTPASINEFFEGLNVDADFTQFEANARTATFNDTLSFVNTLGAVGP